MHEPSSSAASAPGIVDGRELSASELLVLQLRRQRDSIVVLAVVAFLGCHAFYWWSSPQVVGVLHSCEQPSVPPSPPPPPPAPAASQCELRATLPSYEPTGADRDLKLAGARFVDADDAWDAARWLEATLDHEIHEREQRAAIRRLVQRCAPSGDGGARDDDECAGLFH